jgi:hypothetical protein
MDVDIDFEGNPTTTTSSEGVKSGDGVKVDNTPVDIHDDKTNETTDLTRTPENPPVEENTDSGLEAGTELEIDGVSYTIADNGDIIDKDGNVFKEAKDVKQFLEENKPTDEDEEITLGSIKEAIGIDVKDENGNEIDFPDTPQGVKDYVDSVIATKTNEVAEGAVNKLFMDNPMLKQFIDYVKITGTPRGFGEIPDRSGIVLDKDNENRLAAVIRMAAEEFGNASMDEAYIDFLKTSGRLYDTAKSQLDALVAHDKQIRQEIEQRAEQAREQELAELNEYWNSVDNAIKNRKIGNYMLPETFVAERNGQKVTLTLNDFYDYVSKSSEQDEDGNAITGYQKDLSNLSNEAHLNRELLDAWLMFTGNSYDSLVNMAIKEEQVRKLVINSKKNKTRSQVKIAKPKATSASDVLLD